MSEKLDSKIDIACIRCSNGIIQYGSYRVNDLRLAILDGGMDSEKHGIPTSYLALITVIGFSMNPTELLAIAPASRFP
jgi:hypothetical protein